MSIANRRFAAAGLGLLVVTGLCSCVAGVGYEGGVSATYLGGYYEPYGYQYGGWQNGYRVGPPRGGERRLDQPSTHPYRSAPQSRPTPSIPTRSRGH